MTDTTHIIATIQNQEVTPTIIGNAENIITESGLSQFDVKRLIDNAQSGISIENLITALVKIQKSKGGRLHNHTIKKYKRISKKWHNGGGGSLQKLLRSILILAAVGHSSTISVNKINTHVITTSPVYQLQKSSINNPYIHTNKHVPITTYSQSVNISPTSTFKKNITIKNSGNSGNSNNALLTDNADNLNNIDNANTLFDDCINISKEAVNISVTPETVNKIVTTTHDPYKIIETLVSDAVGYIPEVKALQKESYELIKDIPANDVIVIGGHNSMTTSRNPIIGNNQFMPISEQLNACRGMSSCLLDIDNAHNNALLKVVDVVQAGIEKLTDPFNPNKNAKLHKTIYEPNSLTSKHGAMPLNFSNASTKDIYHEIYEFHKANPKVRIDVRIENNNVGPTHIMNVLDTIDIKFKESIYDGSAGPDPTLTQQIESGKMIRFIFEKIKKVDGKPILTPEGYMSAPDGTHVINGSFEGFPAGFIYQGASFVRTKWSAITKLLNAAKAEDHDTIASLLITDDLISKNNVGLIIDAYDTAIGSNVSRLEELTTRFEEIFNRLLPVIRKVCYKKGIILSKGALIMVDQIHPLHIQIANIFNRMNQIKQSTSKTEYKKKMKKMKKMLHRLTRHIVPLYSQLNRLPIPIVDGVMKLVHVLQGKRNFNESGLKDIYGILYNLSTSIITPVVFSYRLIKLLYNKIKPNTSNTKKSNLSYI